MSDSKDPTSPFAPLDNKGWLDPMPRMDLSPGIDAKDAEITRLRAALADAQAVGFAAGVEAAAKRVGFTECPACGGEGWEIYDHEEHDCQTCFGRGVVPHLDKSALTPPDLTAAAARVLLADDAAAHALCAAFVNGLRERSIDTPPYDGWSQKDKDETAGFMQKGLRAIAGDTP